MNDFKAELQQVEDRRQAAIAHLRSHLSPEGSTIHCLIDPTRTGAGAWVRVFAIGYPQDNEAWPVDITYAVGQVVGLAVQERAGASEHWLFLKGAGFNRAERIAEQITKAMQWVQGTIKGHCL